MSSEQNTGVLRRDLKLFPSEKEGSWTLFDPVADRYFRLGQQEYQVVSRLHTNISLTTLQEQLHIGGIRTDKAEILSILAFLSTNGLMQPVYELTEKRVIAGSMAANKMKKKQLLSSWLFFKFPLLTPDRFLGWSWPFIKIILNSRVLKLLGLISIVGYILLISRWHHVTAMFMSTLTGSGLLRYGLTLIIIKGIHELGHAYAAKSAGIRVRNIGLAIMVFMPRLYTDITDSWQIKNRKTRMLIDGAGMGIEILIGGIAALIWASTGAGMLNSICYYLFAVTSINTLLINGNPLLRFDGYYLLMDGTGIDNLYSRSAVAVKEFMRKTFFGLSPSVNRLQLKRSTHIFLIIYGICAFCYRIFLYTSILLIIYYTFAKGLALLLIALELYLLVLSPLLAEIKIVADQRSNFQAGRASITILAFLLILGLLVIPLPWSMDIGGYIRANKAQILYVNQEGYLEKVQSKSSSRMQKGTPLYSLSNPQMEMNRRQTLLSVALVDMEQDQLRSAAKTLGQSRIKEQHRLALDNLLAEINRKIDLLNVTSPIEGTLWWYREDDLIPGRWLKKGEAIGEVYQPGNVTIVGCLPEYELEKVAQGQKVRIYLPDKVKPVMGVISAINPAPVTHSPPAATLSTFGGPISAILENGRYRIVNPYYELFIKPENQQQLSPGRSGIVRIRHHSSVAANLGRTILQLIR